MQPLPVDLAFGLDTVLARTEEPVRVVERQAGHAEEEHRRQAEHRDVNVQPEHPRGQPDPEPPSPRATCHQGRTHRRIILQELYGDIRLRPT